MFTVNVHCNYNVSVLNEVTRNEMVSHFSLLFLCLKVSKYLFMVPLKICTLKFIISTVHPLRSLNLSLVGRQTDRTLSPVWIVKYFISSSPTYGIMSDPSRGMLDLVHTRFQRPLCTSLLTSAFSGIITLISNHGSFVP
jgi:hypothetical protein